MAYSKGSYESSKKYKEKNIKRVPLDMQIELFEALKQAAEVQGETVNGFIKIAIKERMDKVNARVTGSNGCTQATAQGAERTNADTIQGEVMGISIPPAFSSEE